MISGWKVPESKLSIKNAPYPEEKTEIPQKLYDDLEYCLSKGTKEELKWTKIVASKMQTEVTDSSVAWTSHHSKESRDKSDKSRTINSILPIIDNVSHDVHFQSHIMKVATDYTNYLNPGQRTIGCSDCPLYALKKKIQLANPTRVLRCPPPPLKNVCPPWDRNP